MPQGLLALRRDSWLGLAMIGQDCGQELLLVPVCKAVDCQLVAVL